MDELENQRNLEQHHHGLGLGHDQPLYSPSPARKAGISSSLTGQKGSDTSGTTRRASPAGPATTCILQGC